LLYLSGAAAFGGLFASSRAINSCFTVARAALVRPGIDETLFRKISGLQVFSGERTRLCRVLRVSNDTFAAELADDLR